MIDAAAEAAEARAILREHQKKAGHIDAPRCWTCAVFGDLAQALEARSQHIFVPEVGRQKQVEMFQQDGSSEVRTDALV